MVRVEKNIMSGRVEPIPSNIKALKVEYDVRNANILDKQHLRVGESSKAAASSPELISKSYVNIKRYCKPWPICVLTE